jgi:thiol-disulfide isomerase/thioredoxin
MKRIIPALCLAIICLSFKANKPKDYLVFSGKISNATGGGLTLYAGTEKYIKIKEDGSFSDTLRVSPGHYRLLDTVKNKMSVYLENGKDLYLAYDPENFDNTIRFSGEGAVINNYIIKKKQLNTEQENVIKAGGHLMRYELNPASFKAAEVKLKEACLQLLSDTKGIPDHYREMEKRNIQYDYLFKISQYEDYQRNFFGKSDFKAPADFSAELDGLDYTNKADFLFSESYSYLIQVHCLKQAQQIHKADGTPLGIAQLKGIALLENKFIKDSLLFKNASSFISRSDDLQGFYDAFMAGSTNETHKAQMTKVYATLKRVASASPAPKFTGYENFAGGTSSLDDFKGKYLFIDVWATWCGPCVYQFPFLDTIEKAYHGKNIRFVALSIDKPRDRDKWQAYVRENKLEGIQLLADDAFESAFIQAFNIRSIPRFLLIDPKGNIVTNNAPRPSDPELKQLLNSLPL